MNYRATFNVRKIKPWRWPNPTKVWVTEFAGVRICICSDGMWKLFSILPNAKEVSLLVSDTYQEGYRRIPKFEIAGWPDGDKVAKIMGFEYAVGIPQLWVKVEN